MKRFVSHTTMDFEDETVLEGFVKNLPLSPQIQNTILSGESHVDESDESGYPGATNMIHTFSVEEVNND